MLAAPGLVLLLLSRRIESKTPESGSDPMLLGMWLSIIAMVVFAAGLVFFAAALWWLLRKKPMRQGRCAGCGALIGR